MSRFLPHKSIFIYIDFLCKTSVLGHRTREDDEFDQSIPNISPWAEVPGPLDTFRVNESGCSGNTGEERGIETRQGRSWRGCTASSYRSGLRSIHKETGSQGGGTQDCPDERHRCWRTYTSICFPLVDVPRTIRHLPGPWSRRLRVCQQSHTGSLRVCH